MDTAPFYIYPSVVLLFSNLILRGPKLWNILEKSLTSALSFTSFKNLLKIISFCLNFLMYFMLLFAV